MEEGKILLVILFLNSSFNCWSQVYFHGDYQNKTAIIPAHIEKSNPVAGPTVTVNVNFSDTISAVTKYIFGNNANPYTLTGGSDNGDFSPKVFVNGQGPTTKVGGLILTIEQIKAFAYTIDKEITVLSPARCVQYILIENQKEGLINSNIKIDD